MKAVAYSIKPFEKEFLAKANQKKHEITLISNALSFDTSNYAEGKNAVIVFINDDVSGGVIEKLAGYGIKYILTRSVGTEHIDTQHAAKYGIKVANVSAYSSLAIAEHSVALAFALNRKFSKNDHHNYSSEFKNDEFIGFNFSGKTVGIIGLGNIGKAVANIYKGIGCKVIGYDPYLKDNLPGIKLVDFDELLANADIISFHVPLNSSTEHLIRRATINKMKDGVMLINASKSAILNMRDILVGVEGRKIGYLGLDIFENDGGLFEKKSQSNFLNDPLLKDLWQRQNVLVTHHQANLTREGLQDIADQTIKKLDVWQKNDFSDNPHESNILF